MSAAIAFARSNWRWLLPLVLFAGLAIDDGRLRLKIASYESAEARAVKRAGELSDELIISQAQAMAVTEKKVVSYVDRIRTVQAPDTACADDLRMRLGSYGVRDILGREAVRGAAPAMQGPGTGAGPR